MLTTGQYDVFPERLRTVTCTEAISPSRRMIALLTTSGGRLRAATKVSTIETISPTVVIVMNAVTGVRFDSRTRLKRLTTHRPSRCRGSSAGPPHPRQGRPARPDRGSRPCP